MPISPEYLHLVYKGPFPALLYGRASRDPKKKGRSVGDQLDEGRELCDRHGWPIAGEFPDVDRSASRHRKREREQFDKMLDAIAAKEGRILVAWEASRYYRDIEAYIRLRNACADNDVLLCYNGTVYDLSKREDRRATAEDALRAEDEAEGIRDRNLRTQRKLADKGAPSGRAPYGYTRRYDSETGELIDQIPHPVRAEYVQHMFRRFDSGETAYSIAKWLNENPEAAHVGGRPWDIARVREQLRNPAYIGMRVHQGETIGKATWKPIVDEAIFHRVQKILDNPARRTQRDSRVKHLLSHLAICGEHPEAPSKQIAGKRNGGLSYFCKDRLDTAIRADRFEAYVEEGVVAWLGSDAARSAFESGDEDAEAEAARLRVEQLTAQLEEARQLAGELDDEGRPKLSVLSLAAMEKQLMPQIEQARATAERFAVPSSSLVQRLVTAPDVDAVWSGLSIVQKRKVLREIVTVRLHRASGGYSLTSGRITLSFVGQPGFISG
ncbi:recombinase family protein [Streptomyces sp. DSM 41524]|uniref:Recombinase family protein n=1 Tax=Streptomyces asiaticus subsp. ignotus TaxID=3098222 RepID=A0ABU7QAG7_9ACTN|nr:recombinase family protein [Streptomyces sp. DSM 41524]